MDALSFKIILEPDLRAGETLGRVKTRLAALFRSDVSRVERLYERAPVVVKKGLNKEQVQRYKSTIEKTGAICRVLEETKGDNASSEPSGSSVSEIGTRWKKINYRGTYSLQNKGVFFYTIWPIVQVKKLVQVFFDKVLEMISSELMGHSQELSQGGQIFGFLVLSVFSLVMHTFQEYDDLIFLSLLAIWCLDYILAKGAFKQGNRSGRVLLRSVENDRMVWRMEGDDDEPLEVMFKREELDQISISRVPILGGAFQEAVGMSWRIALVLEDGDTLLLGEKRVFGKAMQRAKELADRLNIPLKFLDSVGRSELAQEASEANESPAKSKKEHPPAGKIHTTEKNGKFEVSSAWSQRNFVLLLNRMVRESGFLLFVLIVTGVMIRFGGLLKFLIGRFTGLAAQAPPIDLNFRSILAAFKPKGELLDLLEIAFAIAVMIFYGWRMSRKRRLSIDRHLVKFAVGDAATEALKTDRVDFPLFVPGSEPFILLTDRSRAIIIDGLQTEEEYRAWISKIEEGLEKLRDAGSSQVAAPKT